MFSHRRDVQIQWGDCDPANIVYYPRYFAMFDDSTSILFEAAGYSKQDLVHKYGLVGIPMVDTRAKFHIPSTHGDWITIESRIESFKRSSFEVTHKVFKGEGAGDRGVRDPRAGRPSPGRPGEAEIGADAAGDHRALHTGVRALLG